MIIDLIVFCVLFGKLMKKKKEARRELIEKYSVKIIFEKQSNIYQCLFSP